VHCTGTVSGILLNSVYTLLVGYSGK